MRVFRNVDDPEIITPVILTFGVFDGLHLGHQLIMQRVVERAHASGLPATVITFDPHPRAVLRPETAPPLLQTFEQKMEGLEQLGINQTVVLNFSPSLASLSAQEFLQRYVYGRLDAREVYLGHGFAFGHSREGHFVLLKRVSSELGRIAEEIPEVLLRGHRVSSTMIRRLLSHGRVNLARRMLGRPYSIEGEVVEGHRVGKERLTFATANLRPENFVLPENGVYITLTTIRNTFHRSITNIGHRPTFGNNEDISIETHILDYDETLYGEKIRVFFLYRLRGEKKFKSVDELQAQIERDYSRATGYYQRRAVNNAITHIVSEPE